VLVGRVARLPASQYPRLLAIALLLRHSWCPQDLARTARRLGLSCAVASTEAGLAPESLATRDRGHRRRERTSASLSKPRTSHR
jgi:lambda repressor-like predicted transcriptional regulator